ncbi:MAG: hypothetical protein N3F63_04035 [Thermoplasmata archaeon]|nr:hypothetical protein [Thermoplasmata archaeon]
MIEHEVIVIGDTLSAHITAALLAKKGINVGFVRKPRQRFYEIGNLWLGPTKPLFELAEVLQLSARAGRIKGFFVYKDHRTYRLPVSLGQLLLYSYLPFPARFRTAVDLFKLNRVDPAKVGVCTARDLIETLNFNELTARYLLALGNFATEVAWGGVDAITFFSSVMGLRKAYPDIYTVKPGIEQFLRELKDVYTEHEGVVYEADCNMVSAENDRAIAAFLGENNIEAKFFVMSTEPYELASLMKDWKHPLIEEFAGLRTKCLDVKIVLKEKIAETGAPLVFEDAPLLGFSPANGGIEAGGRMITYWRYFTGTDKNPENLENIVRKFRVVMARAYPNFWSNVETVEHMVQDVPLPTYRKLPQTPLRNLFIGTRNVYGNNLRDEVRAGIDAFMLCHRHLRK